MVCLTSCCRPPTSLHLHMLWYLMSKRKSVKSGGHGGSRRRRRWLLRRRLRRALLSPAAGAHRGATGGGVAAVLALHGIPPLLPLPPLRQLLFHRGVKVLRLTLVGKVEPHLPKKKKEKEIIKQAIANTCKADSGTVVGCAFTIYVDVLMFQWSCFVI